MLFYNFRSQQDVRLIKTGVYVQMIFLVQKVAFIRYLYLSVTLDRDIGVDKSGFAEQGQPNLRGGRIELATRGTQSGNTHRSGLLNDWLTD